MPQPGPGMEPGIEPETRRPWPGGPCSGSRLGVAQLPPWGSPWGLSLPLCGRTRLVLSLSHPGPASASAAPRLPPRVKRPSPGPRLTRVFCSPLPAFLRSQSDVSNYAGQNSRRLFPRPPPVSGRHPSLAYPRAPECGWRGRMEAQPYARPREAGSHRCLGLRMPVGATNPGGVSRPVTQGRSLS